MATQVAFSDLNSWLNNQPVNTPSTPYELEITGLVASNIDESITQGTLGRVLLDNNTKYVDLSATILPSEVTSLGGCFFSCVSLIKAPVMPSGYTGMGGCFDGCSFLIQAPVIPDGVVNIDACFSGCTSLTQPPVIPSSVTDMGRCFDGCTSLTQAPVLPTVSSTLDIQYCFQDCSALTSAPEIPNGVVSLENCFSGCTSLTQAPTIPESVWNMARTFSGCTSLTQAPTIPGNVWNMTGCFYGCTSLTQAPVLPSRVKLLKSCFGNCSSLTQAPELPSNVTDIEFCFWGCSSLIQAPAIPSRVTSLYGCFEDCTSLIQAPVIPDGITSMAYCFHNCVSLTYKPIIPSTVTSSTSCYYNVTTPNWKGTQSQAETFLSTFFAQTADSELQVFANDRETYEYSIYNIEISNLSTFLAGLEPNVITTAYKIYIRGLTTSNASNIKTGLIANSAKFVDLSYTIIPDGTDTEGLFFGGYNQPACNTLVYAPSLPTDQTDLSETFRGCANLQAAPTIPASYTDLTMTFIGCISLTSVPTLPSGLQTAIATFQGCVGIAGTVSLTSYTSLTSMMIMFSGCPLITKVEIAPNVQNIQGAFQDCTSLENVNNIPSSVTVGKYAFSNCQNLTKISEFNVPISTLKNNTNFQNMFLDCDNLTEIGFKPEEASDWHIFRLKFGASTVEGKVFDKNKNATTISSTSITKSQLVLPVLSDELLFTNSISDSDLDDLIENVIEYKYTYFGNANRTINPTNKSFVLWAEDTDHVVTNLSFPADVSHASGVLPVANGGTGQTTQKNVNKAIIAQMTEGTSDVTDGTMFVSSYASNNGFDDTNAPNKPYKRKFSTVWNYIKGKISSILGLTASDYGGNSATATSATSAKKLISGDYVDNVSIDWRSGRESYHTTTSYQTSGNEALVFATKNAVTSFMFVNGEDSITNHASNRWQSLTPALQIKNGKVAIGKLIANNVTPTYALDVNGTVNATEFRGNVTGNSDTAITATWVKGDTMRPANSNLYPQSTNGSLTHFLATSTMTTGKPSTDGHITQMSWDNNGGYGAQFFIPNKTSSGYVPQYRAENGGTWSAWINFITSANIGSQSVNYASKAGTMSTETTFATYFYFKNNYLLFQWGLYTGTPTGGKATIDSTQGFQAYVDKNAYFVYIQDVDDNNPRNNTTQKDTGGYDYVTGVDQQYKASFVVTCVSTRKFYWFTVGVSA